MKKFLLLILILPFVSWAQEDSLDLKKRLSEKVVGLNFSKKNPDIILKCKCSNLPSPLLVVDEKIVDYDKTFKNLDSNEIETIKVLKDENAIEKYGEAGKNGVIEIHLKQKKENSPYLELLSAPMICYAGINQESSKTNYDLAVLDIGYDNFLKMQPPARTFTLNYLQNRNQRYVSVWNQRTLTNPEIYEMAIDYDSQTFYGLEFEHKLYMFFKFMEKKHSISML